MPELPVKEFLSRALAVRNRDGDDLKDFLLEQKEVYEGVVGKRRWWSDVFRVVQIDGRRVGYRWAIANRDEGMEDLGFEFDPKSVCDVEEYQVTETRYRPAPEAGEAGG